MVWVKFTEEKRSANPRKIRAHKSDCQGLEKARSLLCRSVRMRAQRSGARLVCRVAGQGNFGSKCASSRGSSAFARLRGRRADAGDLQLRSVDRTRTAEI